MISELAIEAEASSPPPIPPAKLFGFDYGTKRRDLLFVLLALGSLVTALTFAALQEGVYRVAEFKFGGWLTFVTTCTYTLCAAVEMTFTGSFSRKGAIKDYMFLSMLTLGGMYFTNWSLNYLNYATRIMFKSSKVVPTMLVGTLTQGRSYTLAEYSAAGVLVFGIVLFTLGDREGYPQFHTMGVLLIALGVLCDAGTSNFEEKRFFRVEQPSSQAEVIFYSSLIGAAYGLVLLVWTGEMWPAVRHTLQNPEVLGLMVVSATMGYASIAFVLHLIAQFGATNTEIVKSLRKVLSICVSFMLYPKPVNWKYGLGFIACVSSLGITQFLKSRKRSADGSSSM